MLIVIGGGNLREMTEINDMIADRLSDIRVREERKPKVLFLPTASYESKPYVNSFTREFRTRLKCKTTVGLWLAGEMDYDHLREKFDSVDAVYIGGGRYDVLVSEFARMGVDKLLESFYRRGGLIIGNSAGGMLFYQKAVSDCKKLSGETDDYVLMDGYGWIKGVCCPHANEPDRVAFAERNGLVDCDMIEEYSYRIYE